MAVPMALGPFQFESLSFGVDAQRGLSRDLSTRWADIATVGGLKPLQWTGGDDDTLRIEGVIFPHEFGGLATLEGLRASALAGAILPFVTLGGNVYGLFVIENVSEDQSYHDADGQPRKDVYRLRLKNYPGTLTESISIVTTLF